MNRTSHWTWVALIAALASGLAQGQTTERVSVATGGAQTISDCSFPSMSTDGRFVTFSSTAQNLVAGDTNGVLDVFVHDRQSGTTERVSVATGGGQGNAQSDIPIISDDGRYVTFSSMATNLVVGDTNGFLDIFIHDRQTGVTELVSVATGGAQGNSLSASPSLSVDGRFVAFRSDASNLVAGDTNGQPDIFVRDRQAGTTERMSVSTNGTQGNSASYFPSISADGRFVAFESLASTLVANDSNSNSDVFVRDLQLATTERVSLASSGLQGDSGSGGVSISADGRFVAFQSYSSNLVTGDTNGFSDVLVRDRQNGTTERVSVATGGLQGNGASFWARITADGRFIAMTSYSTNFTSGDTNMRPDVFIRDRQSGTTERVSVSDTGAQGNDDNHGGPISADGRFVAFQSISTNLVVGDTNGIRDIFVRDRGLTQAPVSYCFGDGSGQNCPCGNSGASVHGCANSVQAAGAILAVSGSTSIASDTLVLLGGGMPDSSALYFQGTAPADGGPSSVFGDGLRCAGGTILRLGTKTNAAGSSQYPSGTDAPVSVQGQVTSPGVRTYQVWYHDAATYCTTSTFNFSNGVLVVWTP